jgi:hypothetical protein
MHPRNAKNVKTSCRLKRAKVGKMERIATAFGCSMGAVSRLCKDLLGRDDTGLWTRSMIELAHTPCGRGAKHAPNKSLHMALQEAVGAGSPHFEAARCQFLSDVAKVRDVSSGAPLSAVPNDDVIHAMSFVCTELLRQDAMLRKSARCNNKRDRDGTAVKEDSRERGGTAELEDGESPQETATRRVPAPLEDQASPQETSACDPPQETAACEDGDLPHEAAALEDGELPDEPAALYDRASPQGTAVDLPAAGCTVLVDAMNVMGGEPSCTSVARLAALLASFNGPSGCGGRHALAFLPRQAYCGCHHHCFAQMDRDGWLFVVDGPPGADDVALIAYSAMYAVPIITNDQFVDHIHAARHNKRRVVDMLLVAADRITHTCSGAQWELFTDLGCEPVLRDARYVGRYKTDPYRFWSHRRVLGQLRAASGVQLECPSWEQWQADRRKKAADRYARCGATELQRWVYQMRCSSI